MDSAGVRELLHRVRSGAIEIDDAVAALKFQPFEEFGFAKLDTHRELRCGFPETVFAQGKTIDQVAALFERAAETDRGLFATRIDQAMIARLESRFQSIQIDPVGRTAFLPPRNTVAPVGKALVVTAGTADLPVAREAFSTVQALGVEAELLIDVGVAGLHRLLSSHRVLTTADALVVVAGMEGALPSVVGGLVDRPVIAVPTSIGYGANLNGLSALLCMLTSCAPNIAVVNIDSGFCGGYLAAMIAKQTRRAAK